MKKYDDSVILDKNPSLVVFVKGSNNDKIFNNGEILWSGLNGDTFVGKINEPTWDSVYIVKYSNKKTCIEAIERIIDAGYLKFRILSVKPWSKYKLKLMKFLMTKILSKLPSKIEIDNLDSNNLVEYQSEFTPTKKQFENIQNRDNKPFHMLNLLKYKEVAEYPEDFKGKKGKNNSGATAYQQYSRFAARTTSKLGGFVPIAGEVQGIVFSDENVDWNEFAVMRWESPSKMKIAYGLKDAKDALIHRDAGLDKTLAIAFDPNY